MTLGTLDGHALEQFQTPLPELPLDPVEILTNPLLDGNGVPAPREATPESFG